MCFLTACSLRYEYQRQYTLECPNSTYAPSSSLISRLLSLARYGTPRAVHHCSLLVPMIYPSDWSPEVTILDTIHRQSYQPRRRLRLPKTSDVDLSWARWLLDNNPTLQDIHLPLPLQCFSAVHETTLLRTINVLLSSQPGSTTPKASNILRLRLQCLTF